MKAYRKSIGHQNNCVYLVYIAKILLLDPDDLEALNMPGVQAEILSTLLNY